MVTFARNRKLSASASVAAAKQGRVAFDSWGGLSCPIHSRHRTAHFSRKCVIVCAMELALHVRRLSCRGTHNQMRILVPCRCLILAFAGPINAGTQLESRILTSDDGLPVRS